MFAIKPYIQSAPSLKLSEIRSISMGKGFNIDTLTNESSWRKIKTISKEMLANLMGQSNEIDELINNNLVSAEILLRIAKKPKDMKRDEYDKLLSSAVSLNSEAVTVKKKSGETINAGDFHVKDVCEVQILDNDLINEKDLKLRMGTFAKRLSSEQ